MVTLGGARKIGGTIIKFSQVNGNRRNRKGEREKELKREGKTTKQVKTLLDKLKKTNLKAKWKNQGHKARQNQPI